MSGATFDAGALIALDRHDTVFALAVKSLVNTGTPIAIPSGVLAQVWRDGARQARLADFLKKDNVRVVDLTEEAAKAIGLLCQETGARDVVDVSVVLCARRFGCKNVFTSDPGDIAKIDSALNLIAI